MSASLEPSSRRLSASWDNLRQDTNNNRRVHFQLNNTFETQEPSRTFVSVLRVDIGSSTNQNQARPSELLEPTLRIHLDPRNITLRRQQQRASNRNAYLQRDRPILAPSLSLPSLVQRRSHFGILERFCLKYIKPEIKAEKLMLMKTSDDFFHLFEIIMAFGSQESKAKFSERKDTPLHVKKNTLIDEAVLMSAKVNNKEKLWKSQFINPVAPFVRPIMKKFLEDLIVYLYVEEE